MHHYQNLICVAILTCVSSCNHQHMKEKYGHFSQFGDRLNDINHNEHHHTHFHGNVAIINTPDAAEALNKLAPLLKEKPATSVNANRGLFSPENPAPQFTRYSQEQIKYRGRSRHHSHHGNTRKDKRLTPQEPLVEVPFSVQIIKEYTPRSFNK